MNRTKIIEAILKRSGELEKSALIEALKFLSDTNLLALAIQLELDITTEVL